jgi:hypothetical protein
VYGRKRIRGEDVTLTVQRQQQQSSYRVRYDIDGLATPGIRPESTSRMKFSDESEVS